MNGEGFIFLVIAGLIVMVQLLRWAVHKHRNKALGLPANAEVTSKYDPDRMPPPAVGTSLNPGTWASTGSAAEAGSPRT